MVKSLLSVVFFSLALAPQTASADPSADFLILLDQFYTASASSSVDHKTARAELDLKLAALPTPGVSVPIETQASLTKNVASNIAQGGNGYVGSTALPTNIYQMGPPSAWVKFLAQQLSNPVEYYCGPTVPRSNCQTALLKGKIVQPIVREVAFGAEQDSKLPSADRTLLNNLFQSYYKDLKLETRSYDWNINPGVMLQYGARAGDPRAEIRAADLVKKYLKSARPQGVDHFQDALFALEMYDSRRNRQLDDPAAIEASAILKNALQSKKTPAFIKLKIQVMQKDTVKPNVQPQQSSPPPAAAGAR